MWIKIQLSWMNPGSWLMVIGAMIGLILLLFVLAGCSAPLIHGDRPAKPNRIPVAEGRIVEAAKIVTDHVESSTVAAKKIIHAAETGASGADVNWTADFIDPADRIVADQGAIHVEMGALLGPVISELKAAQIDQEKLGKSLEKVTAERDRAIKEKSEGVQRILTWASAACFIGAIIAIGLCFVPLIDKRLALTVAGALFAAGAALGLIVRFYFWFLIGGGIMFALIGLAVLVMWRKGMLTDGRLAGATKLFEEGKSAEGVAVLRSALPDFDLVWKNRKQKQSAGHRTEMGIEVESGA